MFFSSLPRKLYTIFQHIFPDLTMSGYPHKASHFEYTLCHKVLSGDDRNELYGRQLFSLCQSKKLKEDILIASRSSPLFTSTYIDMSKSSGSLAATLNI